jgi:hypothetical protein
MTTMYRKLEIPPSARHLEAEFLDRMASFESAGVSGRDGELIGARANSLPAAAARPGIGRMLEDRS